MKIVDTDNFGGDYPDEKIIAENINSESFARVMCEALNREFCNDDFASRFYKIVEDDYVLKPGFEP